MSATNQIVSDHLSDLEDHLRLQLSMGKSFHFQPLSEDDILRIIEMIDGQFMTVILLTRVKKTLGK